MKFRLSQHIFGKRKEQPKDDVRVEFIPTTTIYLKSGAYYRLQEFTLEEFPDRFVVSFNNSPVKTTFFKHEISILDEGRQFPKIILKDKI